MVEIKEFNFILLQLRYIHASMVRIAAYRPMNKQPADVLAMIDEGKAARTALISADADLGLARGERNEIGGTAHDLSVRVFAILESVFIGDAGSLTAIGRLPVQDRTVEEWLERAREISKLWGKLPNPPGWTSPFVAWPGMDQAAFDLVLADFEAKNDAFAGVEIDFNLKDGNLHNKLQPRDAQFATTAITTGRKQFKPTDAEWDAISRIPDKPAAQDPSQAVITVATSPAAGQVHLEYDAAHATTWNVLQKGPSEADFVVVADDVIEQVYDQSGLTAGSYQYKVVGLNSRGAGPESAVSTVTVA